MKGLLIATQFLTRLPTPRIAVSNTEFVQSFRWFPAVGLLVGAAMTAAAWAGAHVSPAVGAVSGLVIWVGITGALHLDGLGDIADAVGAAHKGQERLLAVLADPHIGSFGVVTIALQLLAKFVFLEAIITHGLWLILLAIPFAARIAPLFWTKTLPSLHAGLGHQFRDSVNWRLIAAWTIALFGLATLTPALLVTPFLVFAWAAWLRGRIGGISGDGHGAGIELVETGLLFAALIMERLL